MPTSTGPAAARAGLERARATLVRSGAVALAVLTTVAAALAVMEPASVGLEPATTLGLAGPAVLLHLAAAGMPWARLAHWPLVAYLGACYATVVTAAILAEPPGSLLLWAMLLLAMFAGATLPPRHHAALTGGALVALLAVLTAAGGAPTTTELFVFVAVHLLASVFVSLVSTVSTRSVERAADLQERTARVSALVAAVAEAGTRLTADDVGPILETVVRTTAHVGADLAGVYVLTGDGHLSLRAGHGVPAGEQARTFAPEGLLGEVVASGRTVAVSDYPGYEGARPVYVERGMRSGLATPIVTADGIAGVLVVGWLEPHHHEPVEVRALELLAAQAGRAIDLANRYDEQEVAIGRLRELDRLKQDFVATVSHELRTPLTVISGLSETLDRRWDDLPEATRRELLRRVRANAGSLDRIIAKLLDFVRLERDELSTRLEPFDASRMVRATADRLEPLVRPARGLSVRATEGLTVRGDERLVERVLENLIVNAARHTPEGSSVTVVLAREGAAARFCVRDDGPGIAPEDLRRIGERFYRGGDPNERPAGGLGLGLALSGEILRRHGCELRVASEPGEGSRFWFDLPLVRGPGVVELTVDLAADVATPE